VAYTVSLQHVEPRPIAAVRAQIPIRDVPSRFREYLDQVYAAAKTGAISLDGQNIFIYRDASREGALVEVGVEVAGHFSPVDDVAYAETPAGEAVMTTHTGPYSRLGEAHAAVIAWCKENGRERAGVHWEVYGDWEENPEKLQTEVYYSVLPK